MIVEARDRWTSLFPVARDPAVRAIAQTLIPKPNHYAPVLRRKTRGVEDTASRASSDAAITETLFGANRATSGAVREAKSDELAEIVSDEADDLLVRALDEEDDATLFAVRYVIGRRSNVLRRLAVELETLFANEPASPRTLRRIDLLTGLDSAEIGRDWVERAPAALRSRLDLRDDAAWQAEQNEAWRTRPKRTIASLVERVVARDWRGAMQHAIGIGSDSAHRSAVADALAPHLVLAKAGATEERLRALDVFFHAGIDASTLRTLASGLPDTGALRDVLADRARGAGEARGDFARFAETEHAVAVAAVGAFVTRTFGTMQLHAREGRTIQAPALFSRHVGYSHVPVLFAEGRAECHIAIEGTDDGAKVAIYRARAGSLAPVDVFPIPHGARQLLGDGNDLLGPNGVVAEHDWFPTFAGEFAWTGPQRPTLADAFPDFLSSLRARSANAAACRVSLRVRRVSDPAAKQLVAATRWWRSLRSWNACEAQLLLGQHGHHGPQGRSQPQSKHPHL